MSLVIKAAPKEFISALPRYAHRLASFHMNVLTSLQELDKFIIENTRPPLTAELRNKLSFALDQAQAHANDVEKQHRTLSAQLELIDCLTKENEELQQNLEECKARLQESNRRPPPQPPTGIIPGTWVG